MEIAEFRHEMQRLKSLQKSEDLDPLVRRRVLERLRTLWKQHAMSVSAIDKMRAQQFKTLLANCWARARHYKSVLLKFRFTKKLTLDAKRRQKFQLLQRKMNFRMQQWLDRIDKLQTLEQARVYKVLLTQRSHLMKARAKMMNQARMTKWKLDMLLQKNTTSLTGAKLQAHKSAFEQAVRRLQRTSRVISAIVNMEQHAATAELRRSMRRAARAVALARAQSTNAYLPWSARRKIRDTIPALEAVYEQFLRQLARYAQDAKVQQALPALQIEYYRAKDPGVRKQLRIQARTLHKQMKLLAKSIRVNGKILRKEADKAHPPTPMQIMFRLRNARMSLVQRVKMLRDRKRFLRKQLDRQNMKPKRRQKLQKWLDALKAETQKVKTKLRNIKSKMRMALSSVVSQKKKEAAEKEKKLEAQQASTQAQAKSATTATDRKILERKEQLLAARKTQHLARLAMEQARVRNRQLRRVQSRYMCLADFNDLKAQKRWQRRVQSWSASTPSQKRMAVKEERRIDNRIIRQRHICFKHHQLSNNLFHSKVLTMRQEWKMHIHRIKTHLLQPDLDALVRFRLQLSERKITSSFEAWIKRMQQLLMRLDSSLSREGRALPPLPPPKQGKKKPLNLPALSLGDLTQLPDQGNQNATKPGPSSQQSQQATSASQTSQSQQVTSASQMSQGASV